MPSSECSSTPSPKRDARSPASTGSRTSAGIATSTSSCCTGPSGCSGNSRPPDAAAQDLAAAGPARRPARPEPGWSGWCIISSRTTCARCSGWSGPHTCAARPAGRCGPDPVARHARPGAGGLSRSRREAGRRSSGIPLIPMLPWGRRPRGAATGPRLTGPTRPRLLRPYPQLQGN